MNKKILIGTAIIIVIGGLFFFSQKSYQANPKPTSTQENKVEGNAITIQNFTFTPSTLTVKQGAKVTWTNQDSAPHTIKSSSFNSKELGKGESFEFVFNTKGSFDYSCGIHASMRGILIVE